MRKKYFYRRQWFTLVELIVVVAILAILAVWVVLLLFGWVDRAEEARVESDLTTISSALERHYLQNNELPEPADYYQTGDILQWKLDSEIANKIWLREKPTNPWINEPYIYSITENWRDYIVAGWINKEVSYTNTVYAGYQWTNQLLIKWTTSIPVMTDQSYNPLFDWDDDSGILYLCGSIANKVDSVGDCLKDWYEDKDDDDEEDDDDDDEDDDEDDEDKVESIEVTTQPKLEYVEWEELDLSDMEVELTKKSGETEIVGYNYEDLSNDPENGAELAIADHDGEAITVTHDDSGETVQTEELTVKEDLTYDLTIKAEAQIFITGTIDKRSDEQFTIKGGKEDNIEVTEGEKITLKANADHQNLDFDKWSWDTNDIDLEEENLYDNEITFDMPWKNINLIAKNDKGN